MAADTCISAGKRDEYGGIKVLAVPVEIRRPPLGSPGSFPLASAQTGDIVYQRLAGITFSGSYLTAFIVKEVVAEVLSHLQFIDEMSKLSFERIARVAFSHYRYHSDRLKGSIGIDYELEMILAGHCLVNNCVRAFRFWHDWDGNMHCSEVLKERPLSYDAIGAGKDTFLQRFEKKRSCGGLRVHFDIPKTIREIITSKEVDSVAGTVQYGEFDNNGDFRLFGVIERREEHGVPVRTLFVRGSDVERSNPHEDEQGVYLHYDFKDLLELP